MRLRDGSRDSLRGESLDMMGRLGCRRERDPWTELSMAGGNRRYRVGVEGLHLLRFRVRDVDDRVQGMDFVLCSRADSSLVSICHYVTKAPVCLSMVCSYYVISIMPSPYRRSYIYRSMNGYAPYYKLPIVLHKEVRCLPRE